MSFSNLDDNCLRLECKLERRLVAQYRDGLQMIDTVTLSCNAFKACNGSKIGGSS